MLVSKAKKKVNRPSDIVPIMQTILSRLDKHEKMQEHFWVIGLNGANVVQYVDLVSLGLLNQCSVHPREVFARTISDHMAAIIVVHNHPSDKADPSREDTEVTQRLKCAGEVLGIDLLDHVIITNNSYYSFVEHALL